MVGRLATFLYWFIQRVAAQPFFSYDPGGMPRGERVYMYILWLLFLLCFVPAWLYANFIAASARTFTRPLRPKKKWKRYTRTAYVVRVRRLPSIRLRRMREGKKKKETSEQWFKRNFPNYKSRSARRREAKAHRRRKKTDVWEEWVRTRKK